MLQTGEQNGSINRVIGLKSDPWFRWSIQRSEFPGDEIEMLVLETVILSGRKNAGGKQIKAIARSEPRLTLGFSKYWRRSDGRLRRSRRPRSQLPG